jgi:uncharacterized protein (DUF4415 family)
MKKEYDFSKLKRAKPKYLKLMKAPVTIRLETKVIAYFKTLSETTGMPYQSLINFVLKDYAENELKPSANWEDSKS